MLGDEEWLTGEEGVLIFAWKRAGPHCGSKSDQ